MKKLIKSILMLTAVSSLLFSACKKDDGGDSKTYAAPTLVVNDGAKTTNASIAVAVIDVKVEATADQDKKITKITVTREVTGQSPVTFVDTTTASNKITTTFHDEIAAGGVSIGEGDVIKYTVKVSDDNSKSTTDSFVVNINTMVTSPQIILGGPDNTTNLYRFFGVANNYAKYTADTASAESGYKNSEKIDFLYFYNSAGSVQNALYSPDYAFGAGQGWYSATSLWPTKNNTLYKLTSLTASEFDALQGSTFLTELATIDFSTGTQDRVANLMVNQVLAYIRKSDGKRGFILIGNPATGSTGQIVLKVKSEL